MVQRTYYPLTGPDRAPVPAAPPDAPLGLDEIRHGYTLANLDKFTRIGISRNSRYAARDADERYACGWHAAVELLFTSATPPEPYDLIRAAWDAADRLTLRTLEEQGISRFRSDQARTDMPRFHAYWEHVARNTASPETLIVERTALKQIWPRLSQDERQALDALAAFEDYRLAANALGLKYHTYCARVHRARRHFFAWWLEGETPGPRWRDRRIVTPTGQRQSMSASIRRRRRAEVVVKRASTDAAGEGIDLQRDLARTTHGADLRDRPVADDPGTGKTTAEVSR